MARKRHFGIIFGWSRVFQELAFLVPNTVIKFQLLLWGSVAQKNENSERVEMGFCHNGNNAKSSYWGF